MVAPDTIMRRQQKLIANNYDDSKARKPGRPKVILETRGLIVLFATENPLWGYERIEGEFRKFGHHAARTTISNILLENGLETAPKRSKRTT